MTLIKKGKPSVERVKVKDSTEIDDLFSVLSSSKKLVGVSVEKKGSKDDEPKKMKKLTKEQVEEVTLSDLEDLEDEQGEEGEEECCENENSVIHGTAYDPKNDDKFPANSTTSATTPSTVNDSDFFDSRGLKRKTRALTDDGYPIYSPKELKIGMGGGTDLCPFECNCCF